MSEKLQLCIVLQLLILSSLPLQDYSYFICLFYESLPGGVAAQEKRVVQEKMEKPSSCQS